MVDLNRNTIDGKRHRPAVCELAAILVDGPVPTDTIIRRMYGLGEPDGAGNVVRQTAFKARRAGVSIKGAGSGIRSGGYYYLEG